MDKDLRQAAHQERTPVQAGESLFLGESVFLLGRRP